MRKTSNPVIRMLTINQAAELVPGLTRYRIREMCISGEIPCLMAGRKYLICEQVLVDYLTRTCDEREAPTLTVVAGEIRKIGA